jgi:phosphinothricin acetyltransferase
MIVRDARPEDFESVASLLAELGRPAVLGGATESDHRARYHEWLDAPNLHLFVAEDDGRVVGMIDLELLPRLNFETPMAWVPDLVVAESDRSRGAGAALLTRVEEVAREAGAWALTLESANWRTRAHAFYLREGMDDSAHSFTKVLRTDLGWPPAPKDAPTPPTGPVEGIDVRDAESDDVPAIGDIYNHYVAESHHTFDVEPLSPKMGRERFGHYERTGPHRLLVATEGDRVVGFATSNKHRDRPAYGTSVETSVYVAHDATGRGVGTALYAALFEALRGEDLHRALAGITLPNPASVRLHDRFGFHHVGTFTDQGRKFDRYWDVAWYEKELQAPAP